MLNLKERLFTFFHSQTDGQIERMNQTIEQYLRIYSNYQQDNWVSFLSTAEFAYNNARQIFIDYSLFYTNYDYHSRLNLDIRKYLQYSVSIAKVLVENLRLLHDKLIENLKIAQDHQAHYYDTKHKCIQFNVGEKV